MSLKSGLGFQKYVADFWRSSVDGCPIYNQGQREADHIAMGVCLFHFSEKTLMPTVLNSGPHRFFFSKEEHEPPHIHVETAENAAKFWLSPVSLEWAVGYNAREIRQLRELVEENAVFFLERWHEYFRPR